MGEEDSVPTTIRMTNVGSLPTLPSQSHVPKCKECNHEVIYHHRSLGCLVPECVCRAAYFSKDQHAIPDAVLEQWR